MKRSRSLAAVIINAGMFVAALLAFGAAHSQNGETSPSRRSQAQSGGKALFQRYGCYECHGYAGQGGLLSGPPLLGRGLTAEGVFRYARNPQRAMPPYRSNIINDKDLRAISAYVAAMPTGRSAGQIPLLASMKSRVQALDGPAKGNGASAATAAATEAIYAQHCSACHGADLSGGVGPDLRGIRSRRSLPQLIAFITNPTAPMPKLTPEPLSAQDTDRVARWIYDHPPEK